MSIKSIRKKVCFTCYGEKIYFFYKIVYFFILKLLTLTKECGIIYTTKEQQSIINHKGIDVRFKKC